jgi:3-oxoacyl-[acyl-carrier-protein] synthase II
MLINRTGIGCYINGAGMISPQKTYDNDEFLSELTQYDNNVLTCVLPNFKDYINPFQMRRLSRMLRMGLAAAIICLRDARLKTPDAIITSTGYGFQEDMGKFLTEILQQDEQQLTPTYFMQSTHNALSGLIALSVKCRGYNNTYTGKGFAFETALHDAMMLLQEKEAENVLIGSFDEAYQVLCSEYVRMGYLKRESVNNLQLFGSKTEGTLQGEGVAFFLLSDSALPHSMCRLRNLHMVYKPADYGSLSAELIGFLRESGDIAKDQWNVDIQRDCFGHAAEVRFKHLTGEYATASSFALWLGAMILKHQEIPEAVLATPAPPRSHFRTVLVCNHFLGRNYSFFLLTKE